ncbi:MAG: DEAD/DEAH box helicase [Actinomycetes bacterium]
MSASGRTSPSSILDETTPSTPVDLTASFADLGVPAALCELLAAEGISHPFPIQAATMIDTMGGHDVLGRGRTGSGKTLAFVLPILTRLASSGQARMSGRPRALILAPTRELAIQIDTALRPLARALSLRSISIFGGVSQHPQVQALRNGVDVVVACPGRLEDLIAQRHCDLDRVEITVLDEADHMADLGFLPGVKRILDKTPKSGQRMLFSATLDNGIDILVKRYLSDPRTHSVDSAQASVGTMAHHVLHVRDDDRVPVLVDLVAAPGRTIVFTRTKHRAKQLTRLLIANGVSAVEMHGNLSQNVRVRNLAAFSEGRAAVLVATDIAARGIHVDDVTLVIHADPPTEHKAYLHRSGRTARAGNEGVVITLATPSQERDVAQLTRKAGIKPTITQVTVGHPILVELAPGERTKRSAEEIAAALSIGMPTPTPPRAGGAGGGNGGNRRRGQARSSGSGSGSGGGGGQSRGRAGGGRSGSAGGRPGSGAPAGGSRSRGGASRSR